MVYSGSTPGKPEDNGLKIVKHGKQYRATITVPLVVGVDDDIIADLNNLPRLQRLEAVRNAIREGRDYLQPAHIEQSEIVTGLRLIFEQNQETRSVLEKIWEQLEWIKQLFTSLHTYLEGKFARIGQVVVSPFAVTEPEEESEARATQEQLDRRQANLRKKKF